MIATQTIIDQIIINDYKKSILGGKLPTYVLVIFYDRKYYICDGHHRSLAYAELGMFVQCEVFFTDKTYGDLGNKDNYFVQKIKLKLEV